MPNPDLLTRMHKSRQPKDIGSIKVVFSLRKSVSDMARHFRDGKRAKDVPHMKDGAGPEIVNIKINIEKCEGLNVAYDKKMDVRPFFYYRFYTFDDFISMSQRGKDPVFSDSRTFQITLDERTKNYLRSEKLEVFFVDENGPQTGVARGRYSEGDVGAEDLIGRIEIPLGKLADKEQIGPELFIVKDSHKNENGKATVSIKIEEPMDAQLSSRSETSATKKTRTQTEQRIDKVVRLIATKISRKPLDIASIFGLFSGGANITTFEDFKYNCLQRLNLRETLREQDIDFFLENEK